MEGHPGLPKPFFTAHLPGPARRLGTTCGLLLPPQSILSSLPLQLTQCKFNLFTFRAAWLCGAGCQEKVR